MRATSGDEVYNLRTWGAAVLRPYTIVPGDWREEVRR